MATSTGQDTMTTQDTTTNGEPRPPAITVGIVDDHETVGLGLSALIDEEPDIEVVGLARSVEEAIQLVDRRRPAVVLVDFRLPDGTGVDLAEQLAGRDDPPAVVIVTAAADRRTLASALDAGCAGFVSKHADRDELLTAIRAASADDAYFSRDMLRHLAHLRRFDRVDQQELASREIEVLQLTADGLSPEQIADTLFLSPHTVRNHLRHAMSKLDAHTKLEAVVTAIRLRLITVDG